jgi:hypothetical protein
MTRQKQPEISFVPPTRPAPSPGPTLPPLGHDGDLLFARLYLGRGAIERRGAFDLDRRFAGGAVLNLP